MNKKNSTVYLVGAGPGDPDLLTVKANRLLRECEILVYDALISEEILSLTNTNCIHYYVGKKRGNHILNQYQINELLVNLGKDYPCVVRLKGGDPFLFGRGGEEAEWLARHNINFEVVPGITSGMAAPAYIGIPLTHREIGSSVTFVTGHERKGKKNPSVNWRILGNSTDGIVIYMGMNNLDYIISELIAGGLDPETPSIIIQEGTYSTQKYIKSPLNKLLCKKKSYNFSSPSIILIGKVINYQVHQCAPEPRALTIKKLSKLIRL